MQRKLTSFCLIYCCWRTEAQWMQQLPRYIWVLSPLLHSGPDYPAPCTCILHQLKPTNCARIVHHGYLAFSLHQLSTTATLHQCWYTLQQDHRRWRYHRRLLDYQSPFFQLKYPLVHRIPGIIKFLWNDPQTIRSWKIMKENFNLKILLDHKSSGLNKTYLLHKL